LWTEWLTDIALVIGVFFMFVASLGVLRLPDFYARLHAPTKAATLGLLALLTALAIDVPETTTITKAVVAMLFIGATAPLGAHLLGRAAYRCGVRLPPGTVIDEYEPVAAKRESEGAPPAGNEPRDE
jgi:multicomponent Na+:H+ antiporter subunit G